MTGNSTSSFTAANKADITHFPNTNKFYEKFTKKHKILQ